MTALAIVLSVFAIITSAFSLWLTVLAHRWMADAFEIQRRREERSYR